MGRRVIIVPDTDWRNLIERKLAEILQNQKKIMVHLGLIEEEKE